MPVVDFNRAPSKNELRWFGLIVLAFFVLVGSVVQWQLEATRAARLLWGVGSGLALLFYLVRPLRLPIYLAWMNAFAPIGWPPPEDASFCPGWIANSPTGAGTSSPKKSSTACS